jgi:hypothetical protein
MDRLTEAAEQRAAAIARLRALRCAQPVPVQDLRRGLRHVVVLASSSRGGSSVMAEILRNSRHLLHFRAEVNPFLVLAGYGWPESGRDSDALDASDLLDTQPLERLLAHDLGSHAGTLPDEASVEAFATELHWRLSMQWPLERFDDGWVLERTKAAMVQLERHHGWAQGTFPDAAQFHAVFLALVRERHPGVNPWYYDLPPALIQEHCPGAQPSRAPPSAVVLEEPPFVTVSPWRSPSARELELRPLVIKTPSNAYRLPFLQALFPNAEIRVLHLTRNAAASVNGLVDGWRFRGFFAHRSEQALNISGYSEPSAPWSRAWWKFDLPPGWQAWTERSLVEVCGFQWRSAHAAVLDRLDRGGVDHLRIAFEHAVGSHRQRLETFERLATWLRLPDDPTMDRLVAAGLPPIMATKRPRHRRWYDRAELLEPVLQRPDTRELMARLGYTDDPTTWL